LKLETVLIVLVSHQRCLLIKYTESISAVVLCLSDTIIQSMIYNLETAYCS